MILYAVIPEPYIVVLDMRAGNALLECRLALCLAMSLVRSSRPLWPLCVWWLAFVLRPVWGRFLAAFFSGSVGFPTLKNSTPLCNGVRGHAGVILGSLGYAPLEHMGSGVRVGGAAAAVAVFSWFSGTG